MGHPRWRGKWGRALVLLVIVSGVSVAAQEGPPADRLLAEAAEFFNALDYEQAVPALDKAITALEPRAPSSAADRTALVDAFAMRARARFGLDDVEGATADFRALLLLQPAFTFDPTISPRVVALLDTVRKATVGGLRLTVDPADALIEVAGRPVPLSSEPIPITAGDVRVTATRVGFRSFEETVAVTAGEVREVAISLERTSAAVYLVTSPPGVEVLIDGVSRGRTAAGPLPAKYASAAAQLGVSPQDVSEPLVLSDIAVGTHVVAFKADCRVPAERPLVIERLADYRVEPVQLLAAVATVSIQSTPAGATVSLDGKEAGLTPMALADVCEGQHRIDVRGPHGRFSRNVSVTVGEALSVEGVLTPAFALLPSGEPPAPGLPDPRSRVERALRGASHINLYVPSDVELEAAMAGQPRPQDWLAFDAHRRPIGGAASITSAARRELSDRLSKGLGVQGIAAVTQPSTVSSELVVAFLAAGSSQPDVIPLMPEDAASANQAVEQLGFRLPLFRHHIGAVLLEAYDASAVRLVVATVDANGAAARGGLEGGDRILKADGQEVPSASAFERLVQERDPASPLTLEVVGRSGTTRSIRIDLMRTPRVVSVLDQALLFNALAVGLRSRLAAAEPADAPMVRLNLAVALIRIGDFQRAVDELKMLELPSGPGISRGTQQYLLGLAYEGLGDAAAARQAWQTAATVGGTLTDDGPLIADLVASKAAISLHP